MPRLALPDQRWVCAACGKHAACGADRDTLGDTSCVMWAVLCKGERVDSKWVAVELEPQS